MRHYNTFIVRHPIAAATVTLLSIVIASLLCVFRLNIGLWSAVSAAGVGIVVYSLMDMF